MGVRGHADARFGPLRDRFAEVIAGQAGTGAAVAAWCDGRLVAGFYHALATHTLLSPGMLAEAISPQCSGPDRVSGGDSAWGLGFGIGDDGYGMGGLGGSYGGACPAGGYAVGFVTGSAGGHERADELENTLRDCLGLPPGPPARPVPGG